MKSLTSITSLPICSCICYYHSKPKTQRSLQVRSQSFKDEGSSSNLVDANLGVLRTRIEQVMKNEKLEYATPKKIKNIGWDRTNNSIIPANYETQDKNFGNATMVMGTMEVVVLVSGSIGLVFLFGSLMIFLVYALVHLRSLCS